MAIPDMKAWAQSFEEGVYERLARWGDTSPMRSPAAGLHSPVQISCVCPSKLSAESGPTYVVEDPGSIDPAERVSQILRQGHDLPCARFGAAGIHRKVRSLESLPQDVETDVSSFRALVAAFANAARVRAPVLPCAAILHRAHQDLDDVVAPLRKQWPDEDDSLQAIREVHSFFCERMKEWAIESLTGGDLLRFISEELGSGAVLEITLGGGKKDLLH